jgi:hypothetical protein
MNNEEVIDKSYTDAKRVVDVLAEKALLLYIYRDLLKGRADADARRFVGSRGATYD